MKYKEPPYIKLNGAEVDAEEEIRVRSRRKSSSSLFRKQGSISCEVLNRVGRENAMNPNQHTESANDLAASSASPLLDDSDHERPGARMTRNAFSCSAVKEGSSDSVISEILAKRVKGEPLEIYEVIYNYEPKQDDELQLTEGMTVRLLTKETGEKNWFYGEIKDGEGTKEGMFPSKFVNLIGIEAFEISERNIEYIKDDKGEFKFLGQGAFASVYQVMYKKTIPAALKKPRFSDHLRVLKKESLMINRFKHDNIVRLYGICLDKRCEGLVLELCEGGSLKTLLQSYQGAFVSVRVMVEWAIQIAKAMQYVIHNHCIHRDLKTDNILVKERVCLCKVKRHLSNEDPVTPTNNSFSHEDYDDKDRCFSCNNVPLSKLTLKVTDFGLTKAFREENELKRQSKSQVGTHAYLAPEAFVNRQYSEASDVWSFGVILWSILTRQEPYKDAELTKALEVVREQKSTLEVDMECPLEWRELMESCWNILPSERPKFADLHERFCLYRDSLQADGVTSAEEEKVQEAQRSIRDYYNPNRPYTTLEATLEDIYNKIIQAASVLDKSNKKQKAPSQEPRTKGKKLEKSMISGPRDVTHLCHVALASPGTSSAYRTGDGGAGNVLIWNANVTGDQLDPNRIREALRLPAPSLNNNLSNSTPHLNHVEEEYNQGSLKRTPAMKKKKRGGPAVHDPEFASVEVADVGDIKSNASSSSSSSVLLHQNSTGSETSKTASPRVSQNSSPGVNRFNCYSPQVRSPFFHTVPTKPAPRIPAPTPRSQPARETREYSLNEIVPTTNNYQDLEDIYVSLGPRTRARTLPNTMDNRSISMSPPNHPAPNIYHELSTVVPVARPAGQDEEPYIWCGEEPPGSSRIVNNDAYSHPSIASSHSTVTNPHYIYCQPERRDPPRRPPVVESNVTDKYIKPAFPISTLDQVPQIVAPPPPTQQPAITPPAIPPREGTVGLPVRQLAS